MEDEYLMNNSPVLQWGKNFSNKFDLDGCKEILDIGCRQGHLSAHLAERYKQHHFTAIDNLQTEIEQTKQYHISNLNFEIVDALKLDCSDSFDAIVSFSSLHWISNKAKVLQNIFKALKPEGKTYLQFFGFHGRPKNDRFLYQTASSSNWKPYFKNFFPEYSEVTIGEFTSLLENIGFTIHSLDVVKYTTLFEHPEALHNWLRSWATHRKLVPPKKQNTFLAETVQSYLEFHNYSSKAAFPYSEYLLEVVCEKPAANYLPQNIPSYSYGNIKFTPREAYVLKYYLQGKTAKEISLQTSVSSKAIEFHLAKIKEKLNCYRRSEIYQAALSSGFINLIFDTNIQ